MVTSVPSSKSPPSVETVPPLVAVTANVNWITVVVVETWLKRASIVVFAVNVIVIVELDMSVPFQPTNSYPSFGVAVILTDVPLSYVPPVLDTPPPLVAVTANVNWVTVVVVVVLGGV